MNHIAEAPARNAPADDFQLMQALRTSLAGYDENLLAQAERITASFAHDRLASSQWFAWSQAVLALARANLGSAVIATFMQLSEHWRAQRAELLAAIGQAIVAVGSRAGSHTARGLLTALSTTWSPPSDPMDAAVVLAALRGLAEQAPDAVPLVSARLPALLSSVSPAVFDAWISGGLRAYGHDAKKRRAYFALDDALSRRLLGAGDHGDGLAHIEKRLGLDMIALWNVRSPIRPIRAEHDRPIPRRTSFSGGIARLPEAFQGVAGKASEQLYSAAAAHLGAHLRYSRQCFPVGKLKPMQVTLVSLIEDARVEALAMAEFPGLARWWKPFHDLTPRRGTTAAALMLRLVRALFELEAHDDHGWVEKGRTLFLDARDRWHDPGISREIGGLLGNDLGQMRVQFNARNYVVEPTYRDDHMGLWDFGDDAATSEEDLAVVVDAGRAEQREQPEGGEIEQEPDVEQTASARPAQRPMEEGIAVATYPEWDDAIGREREDWTTILECNIDVAAHLTATAADPAVARRVASLARGIAIGRRLRKRGLYEGDMLDLDACVAYRVDRVAGQQPQARVFQREIPGAHDMNVLLLLDLSASTADRDSNGCSVIDVERESASILAGAIDAAGDALAIHGFRSNGREQIRYYPIKDFAEPFDSVTRTRLEAVRSGESTRLGAAMRHAGAQLAGRRAFRRVLLILTDGEPSDIDATNPAYLVNDARHACQYLRKMGIDVFAFGMGAGPFDHLGEIVGERRALRVPTIATLPSRVVQLYADLKK